MIVILKVWYWGCGTEYLGGGGGGVGGVEEVYFNYYCISFYQ